MSRAPRITVALWVGLASVFVAGCSVPAAVQWPATIDRPSPVDRRFVIMVPADDGASRASVVVALLSDYPIELVEEAPFTSIAMHGVVGEVDGDHDVEAVLGQLGRDQRVALVQPWRRFQLEAPAYDDALLGQQTSLRRLNVLEAHRVATGAGVRVAVVDSAVDRRHPDLESRITGADDFVGDEESDDGERHGTAMAGIMAATADNGTGIVGVAPAAEILAFRACTEGQSSEPGCSNFAVARAVDRAIVEAADVVNLSLAGPYDELVARVIGRALAEDVIVVASAGSGREPAFPASLPGVIAVGAYTGGATGSEVILAPGVDVLTTSPGGGYDFVSGSSVATAHVSGIAALVRELEPALTPERVRELLLLRHGGDRVRAEADACAALREVSLGLPASSAALRVCAPI